MPRPRKRAKRLKPPLTIAEILLWADAHRTATGNSPNRNDGEIAMSPLNTWCAVDQALQKGVRGLPGGSSLAKLLATERSKRHKHKQPHLTIKQILTWADHHHDVTGKWPKRDDGAVLASPSYSWRRIDNALRYGTRGLQGGSTLAQLLGKKRGVRNVRDLPPLTEKQILAWADAFHKLRGKWPNENSGPIAGTNGETWQNVNACLMQGHHGCPGGDSLAKLLRRCRRNIARQRHG